MSSNVPFTAQVDIPSLSRVTYFDGERLAASDLNDATTVQREFRWLHNRSLHSWGIGLGFAVTGAKGARQVQVSPGYAIDCQGREIILTETLSKAVPARADDGNGKAVIYYLVAAYPDDSALAVLEHRQGECETQGAVRLQERASVYWKAQGEQTVEAGVEIVLAQARVQNCQLAAPLSLDQRRSARPPQQPFVAAGQTPAGKTMWHTWTIPLGDNRQEALGVKVEVKTTGAGFGGTPDYQAQLRGDRFFPAGSLQPGLLPFVLEGTTFISAPTREGFLFSVLMPRNVLIWDHIVMNPQQLLENPTDALLNVIQKKWWVAWLGVEG